MAQAPSSVFMVRPDSFGFNAETAGSNAFQKETLLCKSRNIREDALKEFESFVKLLQQQDIEVFVFPSPKDKHAPDAVFPNNWISFHENGKVVLYPMLTENRRIERRKEIIDELAESFNVSRIIDFSSKELKGVILEGTGSIVFDHTNKMAYANLSARTNGELFEQVCDLLGYQPLFFRAIDTEGRDIYHTNVLMTIGEGFAVICKEAVVVEDRETVMKSLKKGGLEIVEISYDQLLNFAGNMIQLQSKSGKKYLVMSQAAYTVLNDYQKQTLNKYADFICPDLRTIESIGGGSARCMIAGIHLQKK